MLKHWSTQFKNCSHVASLLGPSSLVALGWPLYCEYNASCENADL